MLDGHETVEIACGKLRWEGAMQDAGRTRNRANSIAESCAGRERYSSKPWKWLRESLMQSCWCGFLGAVGTVFSGQMSSLRLS